jgi:ArsR family transcriptional regulator, arsenate/arsenite/antimonite-responsive transcriptional repressor
VTSLPLAPPTPRALGERCCSPRVRPTVDAERLGSLMRITKALADPVRLQIVDVLRQHAGQVCVCDLEGLFDISQPTLSHHLKKLREAGLVGVERHGQWAYYFVLPDALKELTAWLS